MSKLQRPIPLRRRVREYGVGNCLFRIVGTFLQFVCHPQSCLHLCLYLLCPLSFTRHALYASLDTFQAAFGLDPLSEPHVLDFRSGFSNLPTFASPSAFWSHVRDQLLILPSKSSRRITKLLLGGENATDLDFIAMLRDALGASASLSDGGVPDPTFAVARGAALYARWRQEAPWDCVEDDECDTQRERERRGESSDASKKVELR